MDLRNFARTAAYKVETRPLQSEYRPISIPVEDDLFEPDAEFLGVAEGQSFIIEYQDSKGQFSTRRITVFNISTGRTGIPLLTARCHEKKATRQFRTDRIRSCIDYNGEIHDDVPRFFMETFGMSVLAASAQETQADSDRWKQTVDIIRQEAVLLAALSRADGNVARSEINVIVNYLAQRVEKTAFFLSHREMQGIEAYVNRLRPTEEAIHRALNEIIGHDTSRIRSVLQVAVRVMEADDIRRPEEIEFINEMSQELIGMTLA